MIVVFTSNKNGGIVQLTQTIAETLIKLGEDVTVFCREDANVSSSNYKVERFLPFKTLRKKSRDVISLAKRILSQEPKYVIFTDDALPAALTLSAIKKRAKCRCILSVHDVTSHSGIRTKFINRIKRFIKMFPIRKSYHDTDDILLYSYTSEDLFKTVYPKFQNKTVVMRLGAHLVTDVSNIPNEIDDMSKYILFFGRIDEYKGVDFLLNMFKTEHRLKNLKLIIAGKSVMSFSWLNNDGNQNITILNRFISDEEMNWLFKNAEFVVLPYKDASQSGIIPIAYHYGKPVLISNVDGLIEYVENSKTGYIYTNKGEFVEYTLALYENNKMMTESVLHYSKNLNWEKSLSTLLVFLNERKKSE